jgi:hypothetical protein
MGELNGNTVSMLLYLGVAVLLLHFLLLQTNAFPASYAFL